VKEDTPFPICNDNPRVATLRKRLEKKKKKNGGLSEGANGANGEKEGKKKVDRGLYERARVEWHGESGVHWCKHKTAVSKTNL